MLIDKVLVGEAGQQEAVQLAPRRTSPAGLASRDDSRAIRVPRGVRVVRLVVSAGAEYIAIRTRRPGAAPTAHAGLIGHL